VVREGLYVKAGNFAECDMISSLVQDSLLHVLFHSFHEEQKCLRFMLNRFCWESANACEQDKCYYRVHSGLYIYNVDSIFSYGNLKRNEYLNLLTFHASAEEICMVFSGNRHIRISVNGISVYLKDLHDKYPTTCIPIHDIYKY
jgi:hypothetical protein